jgi:glucans biosynthesis protein C
MLGVFLLHVGEPFTPYAAVKSDQTSMAVTVASGFLFLWIMPFFFVLAGAGAKFALESRTTGQFIRERFRRLMVPYVSGLLIVIPPLGYLEGLAHSRIHCSYFAYYQNFFRGLEFRGGFGFLHTLGAHLWFLAFLFILSVLTARCFSWLRTRSGQNLISKAASICERVGLLTLLVPPVALIQTAFKIGFSGMNGRHLLYFLPFYVAGFVFFSDRRFGQLIRKMNGIALIIGVVGFASLGTMYLAGAGAEFESNPSWSWVSIGYSVVRAFNVWAWIVFALGFGARFLDRANGLYRYAVEMILPFYILHYTVIRLVFIHIVHWDVGVAVQLFLLAVLSFLGTVLLFEVFIKRLRVARFLFGMKTRQA